MKSKHRFGTMKMLFRAVVCLGISLVVVGCHHRRVVATLPPVLKAPDAQPPAPASPLMESPPPDSIATAPPIKVTQAKTKRPSKKSAPKVAPPEAPAPVAVAGNAGGNAPTAEGSIGALSAGGEARPQAQQTAADLIVACEQRLNTTSEGVASQQSSIRKVRYFLKQAKEALDTGDAEGAMTLATKAKVLLDDLERETS